MHTELILVAGPCAYACAATLASTDETAVAIAADHLLHFGGFEATRPTFLFSTGERDLASFKRRAAAMLWAPNLSSATVMRGNFRGACRGQFVRWGAP